MEQDSHEVPKTVQQIIDRSQHTFVMDGAGKAYSSVKVKIDDLRALEATLLALQIQLERVERETIEKCAEVCQRKVDALSSAENGYVEADTNAFIWTNKEAEWTAIVLEEDVIPAIRAIPSTAQTEQQKG